VKRQKRTSHALLLLFGGIALFLTTATLPRQAHAVVTIECEVLIESGQVLELGADPVAVVGINVEEDGEPTEAVPPVAPVPPPSPGPPQIVYLDPNSGPAAGGTDVTIYGFNFAEGSQVTFDDTWITGATVTLAEGEGELDEIQITTPPALTIATLPDGFGAVDVTVINWGGDNAGSDTVADGFTYLLPSPYPGLEGSSTLKWVEVIVSTDALDDFSSTATGADLIEDFRDYLDKLFTGVTIWTDGLSTLEDEQGAFFFNDPVDPSSDDRPLRPLQDLQVPGQSGYGVIDDSENAIAEVYENPLIGSRGRVVSFARNRALGNELRAALIYSELPAPYDPPVTTEDTVGSFRNPDPDNPIMLDQIMYRFICKWPEHDTNPDDGDAQYNEFVYLLDQFEVAGLPLIPIFFGVPGLGWPVRPFIGAPGFVGDIPAHESNQYIGPSGTNEGESPLFDGNDYFITLELGSSWPPNRQRVAHVRVLAGSPQTIFMPAHPPGVHTEPRPDEPFEGCTSDNSLLIGANMLVRVDPVPRRTGVQDYSPPNVFTRIRPDASGTAFEDARIDECLPTIIAMEDPTAVLAIHAHGGDPSENPIFIDQITVTLTDIGGGAQFGRKAADTFPGDGDFDPWFGLDSFVRGCPFPVRGVTVYRDADNNGDFDPNSDLLYYAMWTLYAYNITDPLRAPWFSLESGYEPYVYVQDPGRGGPRRGRDDPEWTIVLDLTARQLARPPGGEWEPLTDNNVADFALESPVDPDDTPDFFVVIRLDSGYDDSGIGVGDGTGIRYGADFRAYIKPEVLTDSADPLNAYAQSVAQQAANAGIISEREVPHYRFPGGIVFSHNPKPFFATTMPETDSPPYTGVLDTHDLVMNMRQNNVFGMGYWEVVPFFLEEDLLLNSGPRSPFYYAQNMLPHTFPGPWAFPPVSDTNYYIPDAQAAALTLYEERNFFEGKAGHRVFAQRIDNLSAPTGVLGLNVVNTPDTRTASLNNLRVARIDCYIVSEDLPHGLTGFEPSDLLPISDDGLGDTGISLWLDNTDDGGSSGWFDSTDDTQVPLITLRVGDTPVPIDLDGITQDRGPDMWGYPVSLEPVNSFVVPPNDTGANQGDDLYVVMQTSDTISYHDRIEVVIPYGGVVFHPVGRSSGSATERHDREFYHDAEWYSTDLPRLAWYSWPLPIEDGDSSYLTADASRAFATSALIANVPTELNPLVVPNIDTNADGVADARAIGPEQEIPVFGLDIATLNEDTEVYLEYLVVEFYNQGGDADFAPLTDLLPFTTDSATGGIALYRDADGVTGNRNGEFDPDVDIPVQFDDPPDLVGVSGEPPIQVRMVFSSPGTDDWAGTDVPINAPSNVALADQENLRQLVPSTFGRDEDGDFISGDPDAGNDFFVMIRTSDKIGRGDDFSVGIVSWGPDTPTGVDPDTFTAPPAPWQPSDEYEIFDENPWSSRGIGFIELLPPRELYDDPDTPAQEFYPEFDFFRTRSTVQAESAVLSATTGVEPSEPGPGPTPGPGDQTPESPFRGGGGGGGCFIATAAFGSPYEDHVATLVAFRDRYLLTNACGTWLVRQYYRMSPPLAESIAAHDGVRTIVRQTIRPIAFMSRLCLATSPACIVAATTALVLVALALIRTRRRRLAPVKVRRG